MIEKILKSIENFQQMISITFLSGENRTQTFSKFQYFITNFLSSKLAELIILNKARYALLQNNL